MQNNETQLEQLRDEYDKALVAHDACLRALTDGRLRGADTLPALVETEACAHEILVAARDRLLAVMVGRNDPPNRTKRRDAVVEHPGPKADS